MIFTYEHYKKLKQIVLENILRITINEYIFIIL